jgi:SAM-dependent methyltransferase
VEYVLGTHDAEIARLALQHRAWRDRVLGLWARAGFSERQTILDVGCGPGCATLDLARLVGPQGKVVAVDQSRRFLDALGSACDEYGVSNVVTCEVDLNTSSLPCVAADGAWCRWVLAFLQRPRDAVEQLATVLRPGGTLAVHEYFDYATWRTAPRSAELEEFVRTVMASWRASGGEPDVGLHLPGWLRASGFELRHVRPIVEIRPATDPMWSWLRAFFDVGRARLGELGFLPASRLDLLWQRFLALEQDPGSLVITPGVLEIVAVRR